MTVDLPDFLHSLCKHLVARAAARTPPVAIPYAATPRGLWYLRADEANAADPYTVVRVSGGPGTTWDPLPRVSLQFWTVGSSAAAALTRAQTVFEAVLDGGGQPARMRVIDGYKAAGDGADGHWTIVSVDPLQRPSPLGPDANRKEVVTFNADVGFFKRD